MIFFPICSEDDGGRSSFRVNMERKKENEKNFIHTETQITKSAGGRIGNLKLAIEEKGEGNFWSCDDISPERRAKLYSPTKGQTEIITEAKKTFTCDKCNKEYNTLNRLQFHKVCEHEKPNSQAGVRRDEKQVLGRPYSGRSMMRTVKVLRKEDPPVLETSNLRPPPNPSPWHALLSQAARHFRTEDAETIRKIKRKLLPAK